MFYQKQQLVSKDINNSDPVVTLPQVVQISENLLLVGYDGAQLLLTVGVQLKEK